MYIYIYIYIHMHPIFPRRLPLRRPLRVPSVQTALLRSLLARSEFASRVQGPQQDVANFSTRSVLTKIFQGLGLWGVPLLRGKTSPLRTEILPRGRAKEIASAVERPTVGDRKLNTGLRERPKNPKISGRAGQSTRFRAPLGQVSGVHK